MIYIYTTLEDETVNHVMNWLIKFNVEFTRVNSIDFLKTYDETNIKPTDFHWFWKWDKKSVSKLEIVNDKILNEKILNSLMSQYNALFETYFSRIGNNILNHPFKIDKSKFTQFEIAKKIGIHVPETIITADKSSLINFFNENKRIITKTLGSGFSILTKNELFKTYTSEVKYKFIEQLPNKFFPSFFQKYIDHKYEVRVFYLNGKFYCMALIKKNKGAIDIAEISSLNELIILPYKLPYMLKLKLKKLMQSMELKMGSIDLLYGKDGNFYFLEVNPSGQFLAYSRKCNYNIVKEIAIYLKEKSYEQTIYE